MFERQSSGVCIIVKGTDTFSLAQFEVNKIAKSAAKNS